jgi:GNAT superfamily N-acetyltransferase
MTTTRTRDLGIRRVGANDRLAVGSTIAAAFFDDPTTRWLLPDLERRHQVIEPMFALYADAYIPHGNVYLTGDGTGAAVWLTPGTELLTPEQEEAFGAALLELAGADAAGRLFQMEEIFASHHPSEPYYYMQFLATVPEFQSRGIGSAFLHRMLADADREHAPAYHEATTPRNRALYERHGYVNLGEFTLPDGGPTLWRMWRYPR